MVSYFSSPSDHLDPALFDEDKLKDSVRTPLISAVSETLHKAGLNHPDTWLLIWLTGSGITYQWADNHDLDVQIGIQYDKFLNANPQFKWVSITDVENRINNYLRTFLWPKMENATFDGKQFTVTYFWNSYVESDIMLINPYAAYDIMKDNWVQKPPSVPSDPKTLYPEAWFGAASDDEHSSVRISSVYSDASRELAAYAPGSPNYVNAQSRMNLMAAQAQSLYDDIHKGRQQAFVPGGKGYFDWHNFRWQQSKESGTKDRLKGVIHVHDQVKRAQDVALYGKPIASAQEALEDAMNLRLGRRYGS